jgi:hypothetical protein
MPNPNTALAAWQLAVIALVAVCTLAAWLIAVFLAARPSGSAGQALASPGTTTGAVAAGTGLAAAASQPRPAQQAERREAA